MSDQPGKFVWAGFAFHQEPTGLMVQERRPVIGEPPPGFVRFSATLTLPLPVPLQQVLKQRVVREEIVLPVDTLAEAFDMLEQVLPDRVEKLKASIQARVAEATKPKVVVPGDPEAPILFGGKPQ